MHPALRAKFLLSKGDASLSESDFLAIFSQGEFTANWFTLETANLWLRHFNEARDHTTEVLEIGSWEGRSTIFLAWLYPKAHVTCVDSFEGGDEHRSLDEFKDVSFSAVEYRFRKNTEPFQQRLTVLKGLSVERLPELKKTFPFIYIDGSHAYKDVLIDSLLCWERLQVHGFIVWDDYFWSMKRKYGRLNPKLAIDQFLTAHRGKYKVIFSGAQVAIQKIDP
jgi:hypothetical protein